MKIIKRDLRKHSNKIKAETAKKFFKTGKGQYGEGDIFLGVPNPEQRTIAKNATGRISIEDIQKLLDSKIHEERFTALLLLSEKYKNSNENDKKTIFDFYIKNAKKVNNWDLVDLSAPTIIGDFLLQKQNRKILIKLAKSNNLWEKRIAIVSTFTFIKNGQFDDTIKISKILLDDSHDLIHKAVGWMLREVGKRNDCLLKKFLKNNYPNLPRTTLRYAIERFPKDLRKRFLDGNL